ncbi:rod shape-determining protein [Candidatus Aerophobetes bacterium]|nr:rod shape-determining protein [Candidatus Aerophobetes bacterium]
MLFTGKKIGIDLGTTNILIYVEGKGIVLNEPSVIAINKGSGKILAIGSEAKEMLGRTPENIIAIRPIKDGVIAEYRMVKSILEFFIRKIYGRWIFFPPYLMLCIPSGGTDVERRAVKNAALQAGAKKVFLIEEPKAAAIGANLDITKSKGNMIIDIGGGTTDIAVISLGEIVVSNSLRIGGDELDEAITRYIRKHYNLAIGENTAEYIKQKIGYAISPPESEEMEIKGRDLVAGLPQKIRISAKEISESLSEPLSFIVGGVKEVLAKTPPELSADIIEKGIVLTGGGSLLKNLDLLIARTTGICAYLAEGPLFCVAIGAGRALENIELLERTY